MAFEVALEHFKDGDADQLLEENNKLREQNLKLQKILASAGSFF